MRADATGTNTVETRKALGTGLAISLLATVLFAIGTVPLLDGAAAWGYVAGTIALSIGSGIAATVYAALLLEPRPAPAESYDLAA